jgi:hypothetical protein
MEVTCQGSPFRNRCASWPFKAPARIPQQPQTMPSHWKEAAAIDRSIGVMPPSIYTRLPLLIEQIAWLADHYPWAFDVVEGVVRRHVARGKGVA